jgi:hypothetical protein
MGDGFNHLRCEIIWGAAERPCCCFARLGEAEISDFDVAVRVEKDVLGFQVAVHDVFAMQMVERQRYLCGVEFSHGIWESLGNDEDQDGEAG